MSNNGHSPTWVNVRVKLGDLKPWQLNPRHITKKKAARLAESFEELGQVETIAVGPDLDVYNGHQRLSVLHKLHGPDYEIDARQADRPLTDEERRKLVIYLHAGAVGEWDWDMVSSWPANELIRNGFDSDLLGDWKKDIAALDNFLNSETEIPSLEELAGQYGEPGERDFWPIIKVQVSPQTKEKYDARMIILPGRDEAEKFDALVSCGC